MMRFLAWLFVRLDRRPSPTSHLPPLNPTLLRLHLHQADEWARHGNPQRVH